LNAATFVIVEQFCQFCAEQIFLLTPDYPYRLTKVFT